MVKLIPPKEHSEMYGQYQEPSYDDDMWDENEADLDMDGALGALPA